MDPKVLELLVRQSHLQAEGVLGHCPVLTPYGPGMLIDGPGMGRTWAVWSPHFHTNADHMPDTWDGQGIFWFDAENLTRSEPDEEIFNAYLMRREWLIASGAWPHGNKRFQF